MGVRHTLLPDGQLQTVAFTVLAQLCGPKANETEMGATLFTKKKWIYTEIQSIKDALEIVKRSGIISILKITQSGLPTAMFSSVLDAADAWS